MSARILVVDDILPNVKLLEAKLSGEYFDVITATSGQEALDKVEAEGPDIILLDIMMPGMDGFEVCERLKANPATAHIPVVMVTALTDATDRVRGLEAGADDFLSKPVNDIALMARVRSLVRLKMTVDEWKIRESTAGQFGMAQENNPMSEKVDQASILIVEDKAYESTKFVETLKRDDDVIDAVESGNEAIRLSNEKDYDLIVISLDMASEDGLRLCSHLRSNERTRAVPILMLAEESEMRRIAQGLDIGAHDYILRPVDRNEFLARVRTQIRRKRFQDKLRANYETSLSMAMMDPLTGLFNRRYLMAHFEKLLSRNAEAKKTMGVLMFDLDHFKKVNDTFGHQAGDDVLKTFAERITQRLRSFDLVARMGGEEFVAVLPDISQDVLIQVAERLRKSLCNQPVAISVEPGHLDVSSSIGAILLAEYVDPDEALKRADDMLYQAKENGRNCVWMEGVGKVTPSDDIPTTREEQMAQLSGAEGGEAVQQPPAAAAPAPAPAPSPEAAAAPAPAPDSAPNSAPAPSAAPAPQPEPQQAAPAPSPAPAPQPEPQQAAPAPAPEPQAAPPLSPDPAPAPQPQPQSQPEPQAAPALSPDPAPAPQPEPPQAVPATEPSPEPQQAAAPAPAPSPDPAPAPAPQPEPQQAAPAPSPDPAPAPAPQPEPQQAAPALSPDPAPPPQAAPAPAPESAPAPQPEPQQAAPAPEPSPAPAPAPAPEPQAAPSPDPATSGMQLEDPNAAAPAPVPQPAPAPQAAPAPDPSIAGMQLEDPNAPAQPQPQATAAPTPAPAPSPEAAGLSLEGDAEGSEGERPKTPEQQDAGTSS